MKKKDSEIEQREERTYMYMYIITCIQTGGGAKWKDLTH